MPQMSKRKHIMSWAKSAIRDVDKCMAHLKRMDEEAEGKNATVTASIDSLVLMGLTYRNLLQKVHDTI